MGKKKGGKGSNPKQQKKKAQRRHHRKQVRRQAEARRAGQTPDSLWSPAETGLMGLADRTDLTLWSTAWLAESAAANGHFEPEAWLWSRLEKLSDEDLLTRLAAIGLEWSAASLAEASAGFSNAIDLVSSLPLWDGLAPLDRDLAWLGTAVLWSRFTPDRPPLELASRALAFDDDFASPDEDIRSILRIGSWLRPHWDALFTDRSDQVVRLAQRWCRRLMGSMGNLSEVDPTHRATVLELVEHLVDAAPPGAQIDNLARECGSCWLILDEVDRAAALGARLLARHPDRALPHLMAADLALATFTPQAEGETANAAAIAILESITPPLTDAVQRALILAELEHLRGEIETDNDDPFGDDAAEDEIPF